MLGLRAIPRRPLNRHRTNAPARADTTAVARHRPAGRELWVTSRRRLPHASAMRAGRPMARHGPQRSPAQHVLPTSSSRSLTCAHRPNRGPGPDPESSRDASYRRQAVKDRHGSDRGPKASCGTVSPGGWQDVSMATIAERILQAIRVSGPLDDDALAKRLDVSPRQTINIAARKLEKLGLVRRYRGSTGRSSTK